MNGTERTATTDGYSLFDFMVLNDTGLAVAANIPAKTPVTQKALLSCSKSTIHYHVSASNSVKISVVDARGKQVATIVDGYKHAGTYDAFLPTTLAQGLYIIHFTAGGKTIATQQVKK